MAAEPIPTERPSDAVLARLDDPVVADNLLLLLDNLDSLAFLALGLSGLLERGDTITQSLADGVAMLRPVDGEGPPLEQLRETAQEGLAAGQLLLDNMDRVEQALTSDLLAPATLDVLGDAAGALVEAKDAAARRQPEVTGPLALLKVLRDPEVQQGLQFVLELSRAFGRRTKA